MTEITRLEKAALLTAGAGASFMTLLWNLAVTVESDATAVFWLRILFAAVSFTAFDLQLWSVVARGWSISGIAALVIISGLSGAIGLEVAGVVDWPALHAAPALALAAFGAHLMISRAATTTTTTAPDQPNVTNTQINIGTLPRTLAQFAAARRAELSDITPEQFALEIGTSVRSVEKLLGSAAVITTTQED
jgi:hypothetical protein